MKRHRDPENVLFVDIMTLHGKMGFVPGAIIDPFQSKHRGDVVKQIRREKNGQAVLGAVNFATP